MKDGRSLKRKTDFITIAGDGIYLSSTATNQIGDFKERKCVVEIETGATRAEYIVIRFPALVDVSSNEAHYVCKRKKGQNNGAYITSRWLAKGLVKVFGSEVLGRHDVTINGTTIRARIGGEDEQATGEENAVQETMETILGNAGSDTEKDTES